MLCSVVGLLLSDVVLAQVFSDNPNKVIKECFSITIQYSSSLYPRKNKRTSKSEVTSKLAKKYFGTKIIE